MASTVFSFNSLNDNFIGFHDWRVVLFKMLFLGAMFLGVRQFAPERGYELSARMWRLLLLLTVTPIGIVSSVVLLGKRYWGMEDGENFCHWYFYFWLCFLLLDFCGQSPY